MEFGSPEAETGASKAVITKTTISICKDPLFSGERLFLRAPLTLWLLNDAAALRLYFLTPALGGQAITNDSPLSPFYTMNKQDVFRRLFPKFLSIQQFTGHKKVCPFSPSPVPSLGRSRSNPKQRTNHS